MILIILLVASIVTSTNFPVWVSNTGIASVEIIHLEDPSAEYTLHLGSYCSTSARGTHSHIPLGGQPMFIICRANFFDFTPRNFQTCVDEHTPNLLGIGPGSDLVAEAGSIDLIRFHPGWTGSQIILGSDQSNFSRNFCAPGSLLNIPVFQLSYNTFRATSHWFTDLTMRIETPATTGGQVISHNWNAFISYSNKLMIVPPSSMTPILAMIGPLSESSSGQLLFSNCTFIREQLPVVTLDFGGVTSAGQLRLYPDDYTRPVDGEHDICDLLIAPDRNVVAVDTAFKFNPLLLHAVNFRTTPDHILLCDARNY